MNTQKNPSCIAHIMQEEHDAVRHTLKLLQEKVSSLLPGKMTPRGLEELKFLFRYLEKRLLFHFDVEDSLGILSDIRNNNMEYYQDVMALEFDHKRLSQEIEACYGSMIHTDFNDGKSILELEKKLEVFIKKLRIHEEKETSLALKAANLDLGNKD